MSIYVLVSNVVYKNHCQFYNLSIATNNATITAIPNDGSGSSNALANSKTTKVHITTKSTLKSSFNTPFNSDRDNLKACSNTKKYPCYTVNIKSSIKTRARNDGKML